MKLSIITINYNNAEGLRKTLASVATQTYRDIEHIIIDGGSTDGSVEVIKEYAERPTPNPSLQGREIIWVSEKDKGIYNAMNKGIEIALGKRVVDTFNRSELVEDKNKGIRKATGDYIQILNSGDLLAAPDVTERMMNVITMASQNIPVLMGNILHFYSDGSKRHEKKKQSNSLMTPQPIDTSMFTFYRGTIPHDAAFVRKDLFEKYGPFDETMQICADWKLYLNMIALGDVVPMYVNIDVVLFDMTGISNTFNELRFLERRTYLKEIIPASVLKDYDRFGNDISIMQRLHRHSWAYCIVWFIERVLFKLEKWNILNK